MPRDSEGPWDVISLLNWTRQYLDQCKLDSPRLAAEILLAHCLGCKRLELYTRHDYRPDKEQLAAFRRLVKCAADREPVAYLVGQKEFYSLAFRVTPAVLIPRPETEALVDEAVTHLRGLPRPGRMWDVCTGSGCVAIAAVTQIETLWVLATDISADALEVAHANAELHGVAERVTFAQTDLLTLPEGIDGARTFDVITANPPYVASADPVAKEVAYEPQQALVAGPEGLEFVLPIIASAGDFLAPGGLLALEFGQGQADSVRDLIIASGVFDEPQILRDHQNIERTACAVRRR